VVKRSGNGRQPGRQTIKAGETRMLEIPIGAERGRLEVQISPSFQPSQTLGGTDSRELALMVKSLRMRSGDNSTTVFPATAP
jgi:hypothetical protein